MNSQEFTSNALRTESKPESLALHKGGTLRMLELLVIAATVADTCKRAIFYGKPLDSDKLLGQLYNLERVCLTLRGVVQDGRMANPEGHPVDLHQPNLRLLHASIGIFGEAGEMLEALIAQMTTGELDTVNFGEELGDVDWYKAIAHDEIGIPEEQIRAAVIAKLKARFGDKFTSDAAHNRDLDAERAILEAGIGGEK